MGASPGTHKDTKGIQRQWGQKSFPVFWVALLSDSHMPRTRSCLGPSKARYPGCHTGYLPGLLPSTLPRHHRGTVGSPRGPKPGWERVCGT